MNNINKIPNCICKIQSLALPTAFEDALSYQEQMCIIINKLNDVIDTINMEGDTLIAQYIDNRFNDIIMDTLYDEPSETLILYLKKD